MISLGGVAGAGRSSHGSAAMLDDIVTGTIMITCRASSGTPATNLELCNKNQRVFRITTTGTLRFGITRATTSQLVVAALANFANFAANALIAVGTVFDTAGVNGAQKSYIGVPGPAGAGFAEPSIYTTQLVGIGGLTTDAADNLLIGNAPTFNTAFDDRIGCAALFGSVLSLTDMDDWRKFPRPIINGVTALFYSEYALGDGGASVRDWSGNANDGAMTSTVRQDHLGNVQLWGPTQRRRH